MLSHCVEQRNEKFASLHCLGMRCSKRLLTDLHRTSIPNSGFLIVALHLPKPREIMHDFSCFGVLSPPFLFADTQDALVKWLCLRILALLHVEACQAVE